MDRQIKLLLTALIGAIALCTALTIGSVYDATRRLKPQVVTKSVTVVATPTQVATPTAKLLPRRVLQSATNSAVKK